MTLTVETWIEALESGKYEQGTFSLRTGDQFCCLGVACDLSGAGKWTPKRHSYRIGSKENTGILPRNLVDTLGLTTQKGDFIFASLPLVLAEQIRKEAGRPFPSDIAALSDLNDYGVSFATIAKVIRARPKGLFREDAP